MEGLTLRIGAIRRFFPAKQLPSLLLVFLLAVCSAAQTASAPSQSKPDSQQFQDVVRYIHEGWDTLRRSMNDCKTVVDPKSPAESVLYLPKEVEPTAELRALAEKCKVRLEQLPVRITKLGDI